MLKLKTLKFKNIGRFTEEQSIDFSNLNGLIQVDAQNKNTNGSSGAGKSTIFNALEYLLGINNTPITILQSRLTKEALSVEGEFDLDGQEVTIRRSKKGLYIKQGQEEIEGSSKLSEEKLDKILGMSRDLFRVLCHKRQKEGGFFLNFTPKETHAFLVDAKGLNDHAKKAEEIDKDLKKLTDLQINLQQKVESAKSGLKSSQEALSTVGESPTPSLITNEFLNDLRSLIDTHRVEIARVEKEHTEQKSNLSKEKPNLSVSPFNRAKIIEFDSELASLQIKTRALESEEIKRQYLIKDQINSLSSKLPILKNQLSSSENAKKEAQRIVLELKKLKEGQCPTCEQSWLTKSAKDKETQLLQSFENYKIIILNGVKAPEEIKVIEQSIGSLKVDLLPRQNPELVEINTKEQEIKLSLTQERKLELEHNTKENQSLKLVSDTYLLKVNALLARQNAELVQAREELSKLEKELSKYVQELQHNEFSIKRYKEILENLNKQISFKELELNSAELELTQLKESIDIVSEAKALIKSFISCSFDEALESIGDKATMIIRGVPNMATATIQLEGIRETKDGKVKEEVTAVIHMDGEQAIPIRSLSGGERSAVDLAIDLAVIDFLEDATGKGMDLFILDEPFTGIDAISIEQILEVLQSSNLNKKLIIVDHNDIIKQFVQNKILVVREGNTSNVVME